MMQHQRLNDQNQNQIAKQLDDQDDPVAFGQSFKTKAEGSSGNISHAAKATIKFLEMMNGQVAPDCPHRSSIQRGFRIA